MSSIPYPGNPGSSESLAWERKLQEEVSAYLTHIWRSAGSPSQVYIALDGVVPYAKIKQQRFRRFKSASLRTADKGGDFQWDTNAITPGTSFMAAMGSALKVAGSKYGWIVSDTEEPGEGEHKVLKWMLSTTIKAGSVIVYGLDADLILLSLLAGDRLGVNYPIFLMRESMAFGKLVRHDEKSNVEVCFFEISSLRTSIQRGSEWSREQFYDYIFGMSFCGNDFLPTGLSLRIRDEGHSILLSGLEALWKTKKHMVVFDEKGVARPSADGLKSFTKWLTQQEERLVLTTIKRKLNARLGESEEDNLPLIEQAEKPLVNICDDGVFIKSGWKSTYNRLALGSNDMSQRKIRVADFWKGWCWILDYYQGRPVDLKWVYPAGYPPTWSDLLEFFELPDSDIVYDDRVPLKPTEQLALVLPMSSWGLLLKTPFRDLPIRAPVYWPNGFHLETFGKRFGWECEPLIPMLTPARLRYEMRYR